MQIKDVLEIHNSFAAESRHRDILGDGFLMKSNPVYRKVKLYALKIGAEYVEAYPQYLLLPFHELANIVSSKKIPYVPSGRMLADVEKRRPETFGIEDVRMPESYHLHEAAHVIAEHLFADVVVKDDQEKILKILMCESFANTVDALACVPADTDIHRFFLEHNCYMHPRKKIMDVMSRLTEVMGFRFTFMLTYFSYLHANFLQKGLTKTRIAELAEDYAPGIAMGAKVAKDTQALIGVGEKLDPQFRTITTGGFLKLEGFKGDVLEILNFKFMPVYERNPGFRRVVEAMAEVLR